MGESGDSPRVTVIGIGYLGLTHAVCMADLGHRVLAIDVDEEKIVKAARGMPRWPRWHRTWRRRA